MAALDFVQISSQEQSVARILQLTELSPSVIFLDGVSGSGKTTISQMLMTRMSSTFRLGVVSVSNELTEDKIREQIVKELAPGAVFDSTEPLIETLSRTLPIVPGNGLLIIDGIPNNSFQCLIELWEWLTYLDHAQPQHKQSVLLLGQKTDLFESSVDQRFKNRTSSLIEIEIETLTQKEQKKLLLHYLNGVNLTPENKQEISSLLISCEGNPGKIIALAGQYMSDDSSPKPAKSPIQIHRGAALVAVFAGVALILSWLIPSLSKKEPASSAPTTQESARQTVALQPEPTAVNPENVTQSNSAQVAQESISNQEETAQPITADTPQDDSKNRVVISDQAIQQMNQQGSNTVVSSQNTEPTSQESENTPDKQIVHSTEQLQPIVNDIKGQTPPVSEQPATELIAPPVKETKVIAPIHENTHKTVETKKKTSLKKADTTKVITKQTQSKPKAKQVAVKSTAISGSVGLQLSASSNEAALKSMAVSLGVTGKSRVLKNSQNNMYVLIYGNYSTAAQAKADVARLPAKLQALKPWPKSFSQLKN